MTHTTPTSAPFRDGESAGARAPLSRVTRAGGALAAKLQSLARRSQRFLGLRVAAPLAVHADAAGHHLALDLEAPLTGLLAGSANPYTFTQQLPTPTGWSAGPLTGTAYEVNDVPGLAGLLVPLRYGDGDWRFRYLRTGAGCPYTVCVTVQVCGAPYAGATVTVTDHTSHAAVAIGTTDDGGQCCLNTDVAATLDVAVTGITGFGTQTRTVTTSCSTTLVMFTLAPRLCFGFSCAGGGTLPSSTALLTGPGGFSAVGGNGLGATMCWTVPAAGSYTITVSPFGNCDPLAATVEVPCQEFVSGPELVATCYWEGDVYGCMQYTLVGGNPFSAAVGLPHATVRIGGLGSTETGVTDALGHFKITTTGSETAGEAVLISHDRYADYDAATVPLTTFPPCGGGLIYGPPSPFSAHTPLQMALADGYTCCSAAGCTELPVPVTLHWADGLGTDTLVCPPSGVGLGGGSAFAGCRLLPPVPGVFAFNPYTGDCGAASLGIHVGYLFSCTTPPTISLFWAVSSCHGATLLSTGPNCLANHTLPSGANTRSVSVTGTVLNCSPLLAVFTPPTTTPDGTVVPPLGTVTISEV